MLFEILCTSKSRRLIDSEQEALLAALTRISREAVESKLSDYQKDSWLFLSSLELESFSFGDRLPFIQNIKISYYKQGNFALVMDISYSGGIQVGLKAAMAMNFRDFAASIHFNPSQFKLILKFNAEPTPRISFMLSDLPTYEMAVTMRSKQLDRASNLIKLLLGNFIRNRFCFPNYLTVLFPEGRSAQIANTKQYQSQLRVRLVSVNLNSEHAAILPFEEINVMAVLNLGEINSKTEIINAELRNTRWNSIHTFNIFNGLENSPKLLQIALYQVLDSNSMNQLGRIEIPYDSITPGLLDIRTLSLSTDQTSSISFEMYLHHMEEDGEKDSNWIFWNCPKPPKQRKTEQDKNIEQVNWDTIKFILSKLSSDSTEEQAHNNLEQEPEEDQDLESSNSENQVINLFDLIVKLLNKTINRLTRNYSSPQVVDILNAFRLELGDFSTRFNLSRPALSIQALPAHNERLAALLRPLIKSFVPESERILKEGQVNEEEAVKKALRDLSRIQKLVSITKNISPDEATNESSPDLLTETPSKITFLSEFKGFLGDQAVKIEINEQEGLKLIKIDQKPEFYFDLEGIFYTTTKNIRSLDLGSSDLFEDMATWEISLLKDRFISFVPLGQSHLFPHRVIDLKDVAEIELIKDRNAFTLGFNADLSMKEALKHANNGILRISFSDGEKFDLFGESRSCDQWYCIISSKISDESNVTEIKWKDLNKIWLLPLNLPFLTCPYALALRHNYLTHLIISSDEIYRAYCKIKTIWLTKRELQGLDLYKTNTNTNISMNTNSSLSSLTSSPPSQKSKSSFASSTTRQDQFSSKTKYDRLIMSNGKIKMSDSMIFMTSIEDLKKTRSNQWNFTITEKAAAFNCSISNFPSGYISIGPEFICYWTTSLNSVTGLPLQNQHILLLPRQAILEISKTLPNWVSSFTGIVLRLKREFYRQGDPIILTGFENNQELELVYNYLLGIN